MTRSDEYKGTITELLTPGDILELDHVFRKAHRFQVQLDNGNFVLAYLPRHRHYIKILPGERVKVKLNDRNLTQGRITRRLKHM